MIGAFSLLITGEGYTMLNNNGAGLAGAILVALLPGWLACQEPDVPAPGDHGAALMQADSYYEELLDCHG